MRSITLISALSAIGLIGILLAPPVAAQDPYADYNRARAYHQYLTSPARVRTFSSLQPGRVWGYDTPTESGLFWLTPGYYHEETSPRGVRRYAVPQRQGGYILRRPVLLPSPAVVVPGYPYPAPPPVTPW